jgi:hypothetical protein
LELNNLTKIYYDFSLIPTASAYSCLPDGYKGSEEGIDSLIIPTLYDYNLNFPADSDLATITEVNVAGGNFKLLQDYLVRNDDAIF